MRGLVQAGQDLWVFGYGSLMWRPDFPFAARERARLSGYHRAFCVSSTHHRGTAERPGLVLGLDLGGACEGIAYRVAAADAAAVLQYLRKRELISGVYREARVLLELHNDQRTVVSALTYIVERCHPSYTGLQTLSEKAHFIRGARGVSGENLDYLLATVRQLSALGIRESSMERLVTLAAPHARHLMGEAPKSISSAPIRRALAHMPVTVLRMRRGDRMRFLYRIRVTGGV